MTESAREEEESQPEHAGLGKAAIIPAAKSLTLPVALVQAPAENNGKANHCTKCAFPKQRKEPLENASHVRNAVARFAQVKGVTEAERRAAWERIQSAAKRYGVELQKAS